MNTAKQTSSPKRPDRFIKENGQKVEIKTTDIQLAHRLGAVVQKARNGYLETPYDQEECFVWVNWCREE